MSLDTATVRRVAALARLRLEEKDVPCMPGDLNGILGWAGLNRSRPQILKGRRP